ncbi:DUF4917 family protein [Enterobacter sp. Cy-643]|uniref:DUF4917 family protein n=1 Tax=Enterobacter sp. Cy-643 TaxID=2608346 RepID=UPI00142276B9|nr:DUF4917 family protein [Enterobacter sp. Cy-643]
MLTFDNAYNHAVETGKPHLLMGNGFSQAWDATIFHYSNLYNSANFGYRDAIIRRIFDSVSTYDFEVAMQQLSHAKNILTIYGSQAAIINQIEADQDSVKNALIDVVSQTHPSYPYEIPNANYINSRLFISKFKNLFTLNYDLLMYWARNQNLLAPVNYDTDDGFRWPQTWSFDIPSQNVFFLHGGLHIYEEQGAIKKHVYDPYGATIIDQVRHNLNNGNFPLFVSEPTADKKEQKIQSNPYLSYCSRRLSKLEGTLFIHGHSMDETDKHIFDKIKSSNVTKVYVSIFGNPNAQLNKDAMHNALKYIGSHNISVEFYDASSVVVW